MSTLKIAFCNRPSWENPLGGDGIQMLKTKEHLEKIFPEIEIDIITNPKEITEKYQLVHIFNYATSTITKEYFKRALELELPIASSSIFWDYSYTSNIIPKFFLRKHYTKNLARINKLVAKLLGRLFNKPVVNSYAFKKDVKWFIEKSNIILPNSQEEGELLLKWANAEDQQNKIHVVINGVDLTPNKIIPKEKFLSQYGIPDNYILQVGRIQVIKNQINLVYALKKHPEIPIVFLGKPVEKFYYKELLKISKKRGNVFFIPEIEHTMVDSFYHYASLHVLLSLRESPGLVTIEALANNCPVLISSKEFLPIKTYFKFQPYSVDPFNIREIEKKVLQAYSERKIGDFNINDFTWEKAAKQTYKAYMQIINNKI